MGPGQGGDLTDDELDRIDGSYDKMVGKLQEGYGYNKQKAEREADKVFGALR